MQTFTSLLLTSLADHCTYILRTYTYFLKWFKVNPLILILKLASERVKWFNVLFKVLSAAKIAFISIFTVISDGI